MGYARAVRVGDIVEVAGTTAVDEQGLVVGGSSAYEQMEFVLTKIEKALHAARAKLEDVVRTRIYLTEMKNWEDIGRAHGERFRDIRPAATMVEVPALISPGLLVEVEATAILIDADQDRSL
jgi:enamine deaminase RidA (YjgF/YER057c/UK114 family)